MRFEEKVHRFVYLLPLLKLKLDQYDTTIFPELLFYMQQLPYLPVLPLNDNDYLQLQAGGFNLFQKNFIIYVLLFIFTKGFPYAEAANADIINNAPESTINYTLNQFYEALKIANYNDYLVKDNDVYDFLDNEFKVQYLQDVLISNKYLLQDKEVGFPTAENLLPKLVSADCYKTNQKNQKCGNEFKTAFFNLKQYKPSKNKVTEITVAEKVDELTVITKVSADEAEKIELFVPPPTPVSDAELNHLAVMTASTLAQQKVLTPKQAQEAAATAPIVQETSQILYKYMKENSIVAIFQVAVIIFGLALFLKNNNIFQLLGKAADGNIINNIVKEQTKDAITNSVNKKPKKLSNLNKSEYIDLLLKCNIIKQKDIIANDGYDKDQVKDIALKNREKIAKCYEEKEDQFNFKLIGGGYLNIDEIFENFKSSSLNGGEYFTCERDAFARTIVSIICLIFALYFGFGFYLRQIRYATIISEAEINLNEYTLFYKELTFIFEKFSKYFQKLFFVQQINQIYLFIKSLSQSVLNFSLVGIFAESQDPKVNKFIEAFENNAYSKLFAYFFGIIQSVLYQFYEGISSPMKHLYNLIYEYWYEKCKGKDVKLNESQKEKIVQALIKTDTGLKLKRTKKPRKSPSPKRKIKK